MMKPIFQKNKPCSEQEVIQALLDSKDHGRRAHEKLQAALNRIISGTTFSSRLGHEMQAVGTDFSLTRISAPDEYDAACLGEIGRLARNAFEMLNPSPHRKQYGQFFTPPTICALACAAAVRSQLDAVIDPMSGTGAMLWAAQDRLEYLGGAETANITGIELDPLAATIAMLPPDEDHSQRLQQPNIVHSDAFVEVSGLLSGDVSKHESHYNAIIGNPPYVRYQNFTSMYQSTYPELTSIFQKELPKEPRSVIADTIIRASLIRHLIGGEGETLKEVTRAAIAMLRSQTLPKKLNAVDACWLKMVACYSGLADLSLPAWLLTWRLARPGAIIAYVTSASWKNREYARFLRYFMLRMLQPLFFIEQEGSWFDDALIPTSLMVFRVRSPQEVAFPLRERESITNAVRIIRVRQEYNLAHSASLQKVAFGLNSAYTANISLESTVCADMIIRAIQAQESDISTDLWTINIIPEQSLIDALFSEDEAAQRSGSGGVSLQELEDPNLYRKYSRSVDTERPAHQTTIPYALQQALDIPFTLPYGFELLTDYNIEVNQGLRTGCNPFFYVRQLTDAEWRQYFPDRSPAEITVTLEHPYAYPNQFLTIIERLRNLHSFVAEEPPSQCPPSTLVKLDKEFGERLAVFPISTLKPVVRYQRSMTHWSVFDTALLPDRVVITGTGATSEDYERLTSYPDHWVSIWKEQYGLSRLPSALTSYISTATRTVLERNGNLVPIPKLSAVAPNVRIPTIPKHLFLFTDTDFPSAIPTWWYTLPILPRHSGAVFMARVNDDSPSAYLNLSSSPAFIDANFSTLTLNTTRISAETLIAFLNSVWVKSLLEAIATPMGGGALKVEAAHLRILPLPHLDSESMAQLEFLGKRLARLSKRDNDAQSIILAIDEIVADQIAKVINIDSSRVLAVLRAFSNELRMRRKR